MDLGEAERPSARAQASPLDALEYLGEGSTLAGEVFNMVSLAGHSSFFIDLDRSDIGHLAQFLKIYRAKAGQTLLREGEAGDFMILIIQGEVSIFRKGYWGTQLFLNSAGPGTTLGEMAMIDGSPRFATCTASEPTTFGVLTRDSMVSIVLEQPALAAKILLRLTRELARRLRHTTSQLLDLMES